MWRCSNYSNNRNDSGNASNSRVWDALVARVFRCFAKVLVRQVSSSLSVAVMMRVWLQKEAAEAKSGIDKAVLSFELWILSRGLKKRL